MKWRRLRRWLAILFVVSVVIVGLTIWYLGSSLLAPANRNVGPPPADLNAFTITIPSESGSNLATWYVPAANACATVILLHPIRGDRRSMLGRARLFHDASYAVLLPDLQAHGESPGQQITMGFLELHDVRAAVDYARKTNPAHRIAVLGWSLGGAATILASPL